jgi:hypothetical protein
MAFLSRVVEGKALRNHSNRPAKGRQVLNPAVKTAKMREAL